MTVTARQGGPPFSVTKGHCHFICAYDIGLAIELDRAESFITSQKQRPRMHHQRRTPHYFDYRPAPLRITHEIDPVVIAGVQSHRVVEIILYDFGAASIVYSFPLEGPFEALLSLSEALYENEYLFADSRRRLEELLAVVRDAIERPHVSEFVEDYLVFRVEAGDLPLGENLVASHAPTIAQILRSEPQRLSEGEIREALSLRISFGRDDLAVVDWNAAILFGTEMDDVQAVLEFANVELLEMRYLDQQLDDSLEHAYELLSKPDHSWLSLFRPDGSQLEHVAQLQVDHAVLFERVGNTLKLLGDQFLARVYRLTAQRFHLEAWDASIHRKLQTLDSIYGKLANRASGRRMEILEWIIILLIALSILVSFVPMAS